MAEDFATDALAASLAVGHESLARGQDGDSEASEDALELVDEGRVLVFTFDAQRDETGIAPLLRPFGLAARAPWALKILEALYVRFLRVRPRLQRLVAG